LLKISLFFVELYPKRMQRKFAVMDMAVKMGANDRLNDSGGARIQEGVRSLEVMPIFLSKCAIKCELKYQLSWDRAGGAVYSPMTDFTMMVEDTVICSLQDLML
jgi:acetyl-CoA carboxylase carboxyltransferase component